MKLAVMQPYIFPYIGYFQLIKAVDTFVFYDDVAFIKGGWINRNNILLNQEKQRITIPLKKPSPNKLINEIEINLESKDYLKLKPKIQQAYSRAPYFKEVFPIIEHLLNKKLTNISRLAAHSITEICQYLGLSTQFLFSSIDFPQTKGRDRADRLIEIAKQKGAHTYINSIGGQALYEKKYFKEHGIDLFFIKTKDIQYTQKTPEFQPNLSIIDVLMNNSKAETLDLLDAYQLI